jgi:hypothetical protein
MFAYIIREKIWTEISGMSDNYIKSINRVKYYIM